MHPCTPVQALITPWNYPLLLSTWKERVVSGGLHVRHCSEQVAPWLLASWLALLPGLTGRLSCPGTHFTFFFTPLALMQVAPALAAGNTCVLKPSELASLTSLELAAIAQEVRESCSCCVPLQLLPRELSWLGQSTAPSRGVSGACTAQVGLPPGVLNVITGTGADAGAPLR